MGSLPGISLPGRPHSSPLHSDVPPFTSPANVFIHIRLHLCVESAVLPTLTNQPTPVQQWTASTSPLPKTFLQSAGAEDLDALGACQRESARWSPTWNQRPDFWSVLQYLVRYTSQGATAYFQDLNPGKMWRQNTVWSSQKSAAKKSSMHAASPIQTYVRHAETLMHTEPYNPSQ
ncbi:hypothetical protein VOLCADRAFT_91136 [Volvox carteri f. nagariensis]|uniref:Uncharacterized protein n=1 Tax=Volvox carteri f. nagariensis TaxID=3068 RepID=D8TW97_VOLCA|nr:uncharacterized protein VOLCADRAFT_91136 [Volvox carteri f. nagariensis]EFJ48437.1 hypothetical protein VOLCADRAFT_91136 [Volvox carteri f. nagariensis]|eukprot:XP_002950691.1 hypothetical protein VOLCADRAFT_91136 [Volvox carteri f. nagariensis]